MPTRNFFVADLNVRGELLAPAAEYRYADLEQIPGAVDIIAECSRALWLWEDEFEAPLNTLRPDVVLRWRASAATAGVATVRCGGELASVSLLASGRDPDADRLTLEAFQRHLLNELRDTGYEPAFALVQLEQRPLVATVNFLSPPDAVAQMLVALGDRCFAAAYFRRHGLA